MKANQRQIYLMGLIAIINFSSINSIYSQSIQFQYGQNGILISKQRDIDKKDFEISGSTVVCKSNLAEFIISTGESATWSNGSNGVKASYTITRDTIIKAILVNKYGCEFEKTKFVKAADLPAKPIIERIGDSLIVNNVSGNFEWYRNGQLFNVGLNFIRTNLEGSYTVKVFDTNGCENISGSFIVTANNDIVNKELIIFPNPSKGNFTIESEMKLLQIRILDFNGKEVLSQVEPSNKIVDISILTNGIYFMEIQTVKTKLYEKIIIFK